MYKPNNQPAWRNSWVNGLLDILFHHNHHGYDTWYIVKYFVVDVWLYYAWSILYLSTSGVTMWSCSNQVFSTIIIEIKHVALHHIVILQLRFHPLDLGQSHMVLVLVYFLTKQKYRKMVSLLFPQTLRMCIVSDASIGCCTSL